MRSTRLTARLAGTAIRPNHVTINAFLLALAAAGLFAMGAYGLAVLGALLLQGSSILDGGGWRARSPQAPLHPGGAWLDTIMDRYADVAVAVAVTVAAAQAIEGSDILVRIGGVATATGFILASCVTKEFELRHKRAPYPNDTVAKLKKRDTATGVIVQSFMS